MSVLIKGGRIITASEDYEGDIYIEGEQVTTIGASLTQVADVQVDATGKMVLPGAIDPHTHLDTSFGGPYTKDDFTSGTISAAFGGTTTVINFATQRRGETVPDALARWHQKLAENKPVIDVGFHMGVTDVSYEGAYDDLAAVVDQGLPSYKLAMAYKGRAMVDDETLFRTMQVAARTGAMVMVHAENGDVIDVLVKQALKDGNTDPVYLALTRPPLAEGEATSRAIDLARLAECRLYVVHISCLEAIEPLARARARGWQTYGETCTPYLFVDEEALAKPDFEAAKYVFTPPPRAKEHHEHLWRALSNGTLSVVATDHCGFDFDGQKTLGRDNFAMIPSGVPGVEHRLHLLHEHGVRTGRISWNRFVDLVATAPARLFGLYPRKGTIAPGSDADIVIWDPDRQLTLSASTHHSASDYNLYEGMEVRGAPEFVFARGRVIIERDKLVGSPGDGRFVPRARYGEPLRPAEVARAAEGDGRPQDRGGGRLGLVAELPEP